MPPPGPSWSHEGAASPAAHLPCTRGQEERGDVGWHELYMSDGGQHKVGPCMLLCFFSRGVLHRYGPPCATLADGVLGFASLLLVA